MTDLTAPDSPSIDWRARLLNDWQRDFPLCERPYAQIAALLGVTQEDVLQAYADWAHQGAMSRIGAVWRAGAGGGALLCAMAVPPLALAAVAGIVSAHPGVNHNYEREHRFNLWFVITGADSATVHQGVTDLEALTGCPALRLPMIRPYRIDLGFDLKSAPRAHAVPRLTTACVQAPDKPLAALLEAGIGLTPEPFAAWAQQTSRSVPQVLSTIQSWLDAGVLRRLGVVVRHHEVGFAANAMVVFDVPDEVVDGLGERLAAQAGVTLCYRRARAPEWPYNLYAMIHGRSRDATGALIATAVAGAGLSDFDRLTLFSRRRFKQQGPRYFRPWTPMPETQHA